VCDKLLTPSEVSKILGIPELTLQNWRTRGGGPRFAKIGKHVRYRPADLNRWLDENSTVRNVRKVG
jgi:excisionase family DNA binding protein